MQRSEVRDVSHHVCGNRYLLEVAAAVAGHPKERFTQQDLAVACQLEKNVVALAVTKLLRGHLIVKLAKDGNTQPYERLQSCYWANAEHLLDELLNRAD